MYTCDNISQMSVILTFDIDINLGKLAPTDSIIINKTVYDIIDYVFPPM